MGTFSTEGFVIIKRIGIRGLKLFCMIETISKVKKYHERYLNHTYTPLTMRWERMPSAEEIRNISLGIALYQQEIKTEKR